MQYLFMASEADSTVLLPGHDNQYGMNLHGEVMACSYEDVRVMWLILDKSRAGEQNQWS